MGYQAVCLLEQGKYNRIVGMKGEKLVDYPVDEALEMTKSLDPVLVDVCNTISFFFCAFLWAGGSVEAEGGVVFCCF